MKGTAEIKREFVNSLINKLNMAEIRIDLEAFFGQESCPNSKHKTIEKLLSRCEWLADHLDELSISDLEYSKSGMQEVADWSYLNIRF